MRKIRLLIALLSVYFFCSCVGIHTYKRIKKDIKLEPEAIRVVDFRVGEINFNAKRRVVFQFQIRHDNFGELNNFDGFCLVREVSYSKKIKKEVKVLDTRFREKKGVRTTIVSIVVEDFRRIEDEQPEEHIKAGQYNFILTFNAGESKAKLLANTQLEYDSEFICTLPFIQWKM